MREKDCTIDQIQRLVNQQTRQLENQETQQTSALERLQSLHDHEIRNMDEKYRQRIEQLSIALNANDKIVEYLKAQILEKDRKLEEVALQLGLKDARLEQLQQVQKFQTREGMMSLHLASDRPASDRPRMPLLQGSNPTIAGLFHKQLVLNQDELGVTTTTTTTLTFSRKGSITPWPGRLMLPTGGSGANMLSPDWMCATPTVTDVSLSPILESITCLPQIKEAS